MENTIRSFDPYRGVEIEVNKCGTFEATVGSDYCRADSMKGIRDQIKQAMTVQAAGQGVSIPVVVFSGDYVLAEHGSEVVTWHSVDYGKLAFKATDPQTGDPVHGYDRVVRADSDIGRQVIDLKRRLRDAYVGYRELANEYQSLEDQHGLCPPVDIGDYDGFDRVAAQVWMVDKLETT